MTARHQLPGKVELRWHDAIDRGIARATRTLRNVRSAWVKDQRVEVQDSRVREYQVNLLITFVLDDMDEDGGGA